jgi:predicted outer membrane repeat protein
MQSGGVWGCDMLGRMTRLANSALISKMRTATASLWCGAVVASLVTSAHAATIFVAPCGDDAWAASSALCQAPDGPKHTIQAAIDASRDGDTVLVAPGTYFEHLNMSGKAITLRGASFGDLPVIDAGGTGTAILCSTAEGPGTLIDGFVINRGFADSGGGALLLGSSPTITRCVFRGNTAQSWGGGVYCSSGAPALSDCAFELNRARVGGGGLLATDTARPSLTRCVFQSNSAYDVSARGGGVLCFGGTISLLNCTFESNSTPYGRGGGLAWQSTDAVITDSAFSLNSSGSSGGGAVEAGAGSCIFTDCSFMRNSGLGSIDGGVSALTVVRCSFSDSTGSGIFCVLGSLALSGSTFVRGTAQSGAGVYCADATAHLEDCTFEQNSCSQTGGGVSLVGTGSMEVVGCTFRSNTAGLTGGGLNAFRITPTVTDCSFEGQTAGLNGGGINVDNGGTFLRCVFTANTAGDGGGMGSSGTVILQDCQLSGNQAVRPTSGSGGGLRSNVGDPRLTNCLFTGNHASAGGAMAENVDASTAIIVGCQFQGNTADQDGGALWINDSSPRVTDCVLQGSHANNGGAVFILGHAPKFVACRMIGNTASRAGGAIYSESTFTTLTNCVVAGSSAMYGGGLYGDASLVNCTFVGTSTSTGFALELWAGTVRNCILWNVTGRDVSAAAVVTYSDLSGPRSGMGNLSLAPAFMDELGPDGTPYSGDEDWRLRPGSPCIDAGDNSALPPIVVTDAGGQARFHDDPGTPDTGAGVSPIVDIGAYEFQGTTCRADFDRSGSVDVRDFLLFLGAYAVSDPRADMDGSGRIDVQDFLAFLAAYAAGC